MQQIKAYSLANAHELVVDKVFYKGSVLETEDDEFTLEIDEGTNLYLADPLAEPMVSPRSRFPKRFLDQYAHDLMYGSDKIFEYDYHGRIYHWNPEKPNDHEGGTDQIEYIINKLRKNPQSRRAIALAWIPSYDEKIDDCPCLQLIQCTIRNDEKGVTRLNKKVIFRSNDMLTAAGANMYALVQQQKLMADALGLPMGYYQHMSLVPHIYLIRDYNDAEKMLSYDAQSKEKFDKRIKYLEENTETFRKKKHEWDAKNRK